MARIVEICLSDLASARAAVLGGADRIELYADLPSGGTTPSLGLIRRVVSLGLPTNVLIRPRPGDFSHDPDDLAVMADDISLARDAGASGLVLGVLLPDLSIDEPSLSRLLALAAPLPVTFHKAIDLTPDPLASLSTLIALGVRRVLTSGGPGPARENIALLRAMNDLAAGRIDLIVGGGLTESDLPGLLDATGIDQAHFGSAVAGPPSPPGPFGARPAEVDPARVARVVRLVRGG